MSAAETTMQFQEAWSRHYGTSLPLGWNLRRSERPWVRLHSLPFSKRYPEDDMERSMVLSRANTLADDILGIGSSCWIVEARYGIDELAGELWSVSAEDDPDSPVWHFHVREEQWLSGKYDAKLLAIADDQPNRAIWMRRETGAVFAPYDGGFDFFLPTWEEAEAIKEGHRDWLSDHPDGL
jgi:hypothetical protein